MGPPQFLPAAPYFQRLSPQRAFGPRSLPAALWPPPVPPQLCGLRVLVNYLLPVSHCNKPRYCTTVNTQLKPLKKPSNRRMVVFISKRLPTVKRLHHRQVIEIHLAIPSQGRPRCPKRFPHWGICGLSPVVKVNPKTKVIQLQVKNNNQTNKLKNTIKIYY